MLFPEPGAPRITDLSLASSASIPLGVIVSPSGSTSTSRRGTYPSLASPNASWTAFRYRLGQSGKVRLQIFDVNGRLRRLLVQTEQSRGEFTSDWNGCDDRENPLPSGIYLCCLSLEKEQLISKVLMAR